jgi:farnesyl diphosphate synthase
MHYAAALGGKRMRPLLVWAAGECLGADSAALDAAALATELVHAYSLVHDDLPCMDNDVLRRGMPTVHVRFGEAMALLAGDALQTRAFEVLTGDAALAPALQARLCRLLAGAAGAAGMAGGQATDLLATGQRLDLDALRDMHARKTGALLRASVLMGVACAAERDAELASRCEPALRDYAENIGLAFQVVDDVLDASMDSATLGKTAGKDAEQGKATFVSLLGVEPARQYAQRLLDQALEALRRLPPPAQQRTQRLAELARRVLARSH